MNNEDALVLAAATTACLAAIWFWNTHVRRVPLEDFGLDLVRRVLRFEPPTVRERILQRGWMTSGEWESMNRRQLAALEDDLRRRPAWPMGAQARTQTESPAQSRAFSPSPWTRPCDSTVRRR